MLEDFFIGVSKMLIAITDNLEKDTLIKQLLRIESIVSGVILRLPWERPEITSFIKELLHKGFQKDKIIIHSDITLLTQFQLSRIHFKEDDPKAYKVKQQRPEISVSMAVHHQDICQKAKDNRIDFGIYSHLFPTPSKPGVQPRTAEEIQAALNTGLPLVALGGITEETIHHVPHQFIGIAGIRLFQLPNAVLQTLNEVIVSKHMTL